MLGHHEHPLVFHLVYIENIIFVAFLHLQTLLMQVFENLNSTRDFKLVYHGSNQHTLASAMAEINELATWPIEGIVPAIWVFVLEVDLDPFESLVDGFKAYLSVDVVGILQSFLVSFPPTFLL